MTNTDEKKQKKTKIKRQTRHFATPRYLPTTPPLPPLRIRTTAQKINKMIDKKKNQMLTLLSTKKPFEYNIL